MLINNQSSDSLSLYIYIKKKGLASAYCCCAAFQICNDVPKCHPTAITVTNTINPNQLAGPYLNRVAFARHRELTGGRDVSVCAGLLEQSVELLGTGSLFCLCSLGEHNPLSVPLDLHPPGLAMGLSVCVGLTSLARKEVLQPVIVELQHIGWNLKGSTAARKRGTKGSDVFYLPNMVCLYAGEITSATLKLNLELFSRMISNMALKALGMIPGFFCSLSPTIVKVFPEPVWPYAKTQTL